MEPIDPAAFDPNTSQFLPVWWDFLTMFRLFGMFWFVVGWFGLGLTLAPWVFQKFREGTAGYVKWMVDMFDAMFMRVEPRWCAASILVSMGIFAALGWWLTSALPEGFGYVALRFGITAFLTFPPFNIPMGFRLPRHVVQWLWDWRINRFEDQLLDALAFMSNGLRSGLSLIQTMEMVVEELANPISEEFGLVLSEQRVGVPFEEALVNLEKRIGTEDVQIMVTSINILRQSGGNLSETFQTLSFTIRERKKVKGRIKTLTAQNVSQAVIVTILPFALGGVLWAFDHELVGRLWSTWLGWVFILVMLSLQAGGALIMRKIIQIRV